MLDNPEFDYHGILYPYADILEMPTFDFLKY